MSLTSQIITADFPDLDKVEALNNEAFPEEERIPLSEFLRYEEQEDANFFAFYHARRLWKRSNLSLHNFRVYRQYELLHLFVHHRENF